MEFDDDIIPLARRLDEGLLRIQNEVLPLLAPLNEDVLVAEYTIDEQARISLAAAFVLVILTHAHNRLRRVTAGGVDAQLRLKMERVVEYVDKLREITLWDKEKAGGALEKKEEDNEGKKEGGEVEKTKGRGRKRPRGVTDGDKNTSQSQAEDVYGDGILFTGVKDEAGRSKTDKTTSALVENLLRQVKKV